MTTELSPLPCPHSLPQSGWTTDGPWCTALQMQKDFLLLLKKFGVPHIPFGRSVLIDVSRFYQHLSGWLEPVSLSAIATFIPSQLRKWFLIEGGTNQQT